MGRYTGRCGGTRGDGEVYGAIGRARERWGGKWGDGQSAGPMERYIGIWRSMGDGKARENYCLVYGIGEM